MQKPIIALSTSIFTGKFEDGSKMLETAKQAGFDYVELGHSVKLTMVDGILKALDNDTIKVSSVHNFCPLPAGIYTPSPDLYQPNSPSQKEVLSWQINTKKTISFAKRVSAKAMVCHLGSLNFFFRQTNKKLLKIMDTLTEKEIKKTKFKEDKKFQNEVNKLLKLYLKKQDKDHMRISNSLEEVLPFAKENNIVIAYENRDGLRQLPLEENFNFLEEKFNDSNLKIWHDIGHSGKKELIYNNIKQEDFIKSHMDKIQGWHIHDVSDNGEDHIAIGDGILNFEKIKKFFKPNHIFTLEFSPKVDLQKAIDSRKKLEDMICNL